MSPNSSAEIWIAPEFNSDPSRSAKLHTINELEAIEETTRKEAYKIGYQEGYAIGQADVRRLVAQFEGVVSSLVKPLDRLDEEVFAAISQLSVQIAGNLLERAYQADPQLLSALVRVALDTVGNSERTVEIRMHPDDLKALNPLLPDINHARVIADSALRRGDLRVHTDTMRINGELESRLRSALQSVLDSSSEQS